MIRSILEFILLTIGIFGWIISIRTLVFFLKGK